MLINVKIIKITNTNAINSVSLREAERRSTPGKKEIATPFGLAMTCKDIYYVCIIKHIDGGDEEREAGEGESNYLNNGA